MELFRAEKIATVTDHSNHDCRFCGGKLTLLKRSWNLKAELSPICLNAGGAESALGPIKAAQLAASSFFIFGFPAKAADQHEDGQSARPHRAALVTHPRR
jgi:hypothetical protein